MNAKVIQSVIRPGERRSEPGTNKRRKKEQKMKSLVFRPV